MYCATLPTGVPGSPKFAFHPEDLTRPQIGLALRVPSLVHQLGVSLTLVDPSGWHAVHTVPNVLSFELEHGIEVERWTYNERCMTQAARQKSAVLGQHAGFSDLFVPICEGNRARQMLVAGPFLRRPTTAADLIEQWRALTGRYAHTGDPEFARYASGRLSTVVFDDSQVEVFKTFGERLAALIAERGDPTKLVLELEKMGHILADATFAPRMWDAARTMVDPNTARTWASPLLVDQLAELHLTRVPEQAMVALTAGQREDSDPVEELIRRDAFQRACLDWARKRGNLACGQIGDYGVMFLLPRQRSAARARAGFVQLADKVRGLARKLGLGLHVGTSSGADGGSLPENYYAALTAAEEALSRNAAVVHSAGKKQQRGHLLLDLRRGLAETDVRRPLDLSARFERYLQVVATHTGYGLEAARLYLESGFERLAEPFLEHGVLSPRTFEDLSSGLEQAAGAARTIRELFESYRRAVADLESALRLPTQARRESNLRRAVTFIRDNLGGPLGLAEVAHAGGFAPDYFSRLFKQRERVTFEVYVSQLRVERAKQLLARTTFSVEAIAQLCGFASGPYFHRVFKGMSGITPRTYRKHVASKDLARSARTERATSRHARVNRSLTANPPSVTNDRARSTRARAPI